MTMPFVGVVSGKRVLETGWVEMLFEGVGKSVTFVTCRHTPAEVYFYGAAKQRCFTVKIFDLHMRQRLKRGIRHSYYALSELRSFVENCSEIYVCVPNDGGDYYENQIIELALQRDIPIFTHNAERSSSWREYRKLNQKRVVGAKVVPSLQDSINNLKYVLTLRFLTKDNATKEQLGQYARESDEIILKWIKANGITEYLVEGFGDKLHYDEKRKQQYIEICIRHSIEEFHKTIYIH